MLFSNIAELFVLLYELLDHIRESVSQIPTSSKSSSAQHSDVMHLRALIGDL